MAHISLIFERNQDARVVLLTGDDYPDDEFDQSVRGVNVLDAEDQMVELQIQAEAEGAIVAYLDADQCEILAVALLQQVRRIRAAEAAG